jgi:hypothetical protein
MKCPLGSGGRIGGRIDVGIGISRDTRHIRFNVRSRNLLRADARFPADGNHFAAFDGFANLAKRFLTGFEKRRLLFSCQVGSGETSVLLVHCSPR